MGLRAPIPGLLGWLPKDASYWLCVLLFGKQLHTYTYSLTRRHIPSVLSSFPHLLLSYAISLRITWVQELQVMIGRESAECDPSLADLVRLLRSVQREFGRSASLEGVIQALVAQDLERQRASRKRKPTCPREAVAAVRQEAVI